MHISSRPELKNYIEENEQILWEGKPSLIFFILSAHLAPGIIGLLIVLSSFIMLGISTQTAGAFLLMTIGIVTMLINPLMYFVKWQFIDYLVSDRRVLIRTDFISKDPLAYNFSAVSKVSVDKTNLELITGGIAGTVVLTITPPEGQMIVGSLPTIKLAHIAKPHNVAKFITPGAQNQTTTISMPGFAMPPIPEMNTTQTTSTTYQTTSTITENF